MEFVLRFGVMPIGVFQSTIEKHSCRIDEIRFEKKSILAAKRYTTKVINADSKMLELFCLTLRKNKIKFGKWEDRRRPYLDNTSVRAISRMGINPTDDYPYDMLEEYKSRILPDVVYCAYMVLCWEV